MVVQVNGCPNALNAALNEREMVSDPKTQTHERVPRQKKEYSRAWSKLNLMHFSSFKVHLMQYRLTIAQDQALCKYLVLERRRPRMAF